MSRRPQGQDARRHARRRSCGLGPGNDERARRSRQDPRGQAGIERRDGRPIVIEQLQQRDDGDVGDGARARRGPERARHVMPPSDEAPLERGQRRRDRSQAAPAPRRTCARSNRRRIPQSPPALRPGGDQTRLARPSEIGDVTARRARNSAASSRSIDRLTRGSLGVAASIEQRSLIAKRCVHAACARESRRSAARATSALDCLRNAAAARSTRHPRSAAATALTLRRLPKNDPRREQLLADQIAGSLTYDDPMRA